MANVMKIASRRTEVRVDGLRLVVDEGTCNPAPFFGASFAPLFRTALEGVGPATQVLDVGTGGGVWALMAVRKGAQVTATELEHVSFDALVESAALNELAVPQHLHGDLFEPVRGERFDRVLFNPPFHFGTPTDERERAYLGGEDGEVVHRFLDELPDHLSTSGRGFLILPETERRGYERSLERFFPVVRESQWAPVLGRAQLLELTPR